MAKIINGIIYSNDMKTVIGADSDITIAVIEDGAKEITGYAFEGCEQLEELPLPNSISEIAQGAFSDCPNLLKVKLSPHVWAKQEWFEDLPESFEIICDPDSHTFSRMQFEPFFRAHIASLALEDLKKNKIHKMQSTSVASLLSVFCDRYDDYEFQILGVVEEYAYVIIRLGKNCMYLAFRVDTAAWHEMIARILLILDDKLLDENEKYSFIYDTIGKSDRNLLFVNMKYEYSKEMVWKGDEYGRFCIFSPSTLFKGDYSAVFDLEIAGCQRIDSFAFQKHEHFQSVAIYEGTKVIESAAFENCTGIKTLELPESLELIESCAFRGCRSIKSLVIPSGVRKIEAQAFANCEARESLSFKNGVEDIRHKAFENCPNLQKITLSRSLKYLDTELFSDCASLNEIEYNGTLADWENIKKVKGWDCDRDTFWNEGCPAKVVHCADGDAEI